MAQEVITSSRSIILAMEPLHKHACNSTIAECNTEDRMLMESEISRKFSEKKRQCVEVLRKIQDHSLGFLYNF